MNQIAWRVTTALVACACVGLQSCNDKDAKSAWNDVVRKCADSDISARTILYFGPSNNVGPASIWRKGPDGGFRLRWTVDDAKWAQPHILPGASFTCEGSSVTSFSFNPSLSLSSDITPISAELSADLKRSSNVAVKVASLSWDTLKEGPFEASLGQLPSDDPIKSDLNTGTRFVAIRALRVSGFSADLTFSANDAAALDAKYKGEIASNYTGTLGAAFSVSRINDTTIRITASDFYIAGEIGAYKTTGFAGADSDHIGQPELVDSAQASLDSR